MKKSRIKAAALALFACLIFLAYTNCAPPTQYKLEGGVVVGNPMVEFALSPYTKTDPAFTLTLCVAGITLQRSNGQSQYIVVSPTESIVTEGGGKLASEKVASGFYHGIRLHLSASCASGKSVLLVNSQGSFFSDDEIELRYLGHSVIHEPAQLGLETQGLVEILEPVAASAEIVDRAQSLQQTFENLPVQCPLNYLPVPALSGYTQNEFCIAKYEAKNKAGSAASEPSGTPWVGLTRDAAIAACQSNGPGFDLMTNEHFQTLARNIELVAANWSGGTIGAAGGISQGHADNNPASNLAASARDTQACDGTGASCSDVTWHNQRRTHQLSSGYVIWDVAGNVAEWVKNGNTTSYGPDQYISQVVDPAAKQIWGPAGTYTNLNSGVFGGLGFGDFNADQAVTRGGSRVDGAMAGVFRANLVWNLVDTSANVGFRCVYQP